MSVILAAYLLIGTLYAIRTPVWQVPDEPAHYNYIRQIAETGALPRLEKGDYDQKYLEQLTGEKFPPTLPLDRVQYQDYQPPLYYLLATPAFLAFGGALLPLRLFSLALGAGVIVFAYLAVRELAGSHTVLPLLAAGIIAFIPQHIAMLAGVNNDSLSELLIAIGLGLVLRYNRRGWPSACRLWPLALVLGLAFLTKVQAYVLAPVIVLAVLIRWLRQRPAVEWQAGPRVKLATGSLERGAAGWTLSSGGLPLTSPAGQVVQTLTDLLRLRLAFWETARPLIVDLAYVFAPALLLGALYWGRNFVVCGPLDAVCGSWHNQVVVGQPTTREWIAQFGWWGNPSSLLNRFFVFTFDSFWGVFGWMGVFMDQRVYWALLAFAAALVVGALGAARSWRLLSGVQRDGAILLTLSALVTLALYLYYNVGFVQHQGRYLFPALVPLGAAAAVGLRQWAKWLRVLRIPYSVEALLPFVPIVLMAALDVFALYRFIIPALAR